MKVCSYSVFRSFIRSVIRSFMPSYCSSRSFTGSYYFSCSHSVILSLKSVSSLIRSLHIYRLYFFIQSCLIIPPSSVLRSIDSTHFLFWASFIHPSIHYFVHSFPRASIDGCNSLARSDYTRSLVSSINTFVLPRRLPTRHVRWAGGVESGLPPSSKTRSTRARGSRP